MRWFKHMSDAADNEKLAEVLDLHGASAYGVFWLIVEAIAKQMDASDKCEVKYSEKKWTHIAHVDRRTLAKYLQTFSNLALIVLQNCDKFVTISIPKLLELRDEYTRKSGQTPKENQEQEEEAEGDKEGNKDVEDNDQQRQLREVIYANKDKILKLAPDTKESFDFTAECCVAFYRSKKIGVDPYFTALKWFRNEKPKKKESNGECEYPEFNPQEAC